MHVSPGKGGFLPLETVSSFTQTNGPCLVQSQLPLPCPRPHPCPLQPRGIPSTAPSFPSILSLLLPLPPPVLSATPFHMQCLNSSFQLLQSRKHSKKSCWERLTAQIEVQPLVNKNLNQVTQDMPTSAQFPPTRLYKPPLNRAGKHFSYFHFHPAYTPWVTKRQNGENRYSESSW